MEPASTDPYQTPKEPGLPPEPPPSGKPGGRIPLGVSLGLLALGGFSSPSLGFGVIALTFATAGILMASGNLQRLAGIALSAACMAMIYFTWDF